MQPLLQRAALLKLAAEEAEWLFASRDPRRIRGVLPQRPAVVVTDGGGQVAWAMGAQAGVMASFAVSVQDSTGAGDAFLAGLLHRLCAEPELLTSGTPEAVAAALRFAAACGALVCQGAGAIDPQPTSAAVQAFLAAQP